jgi:hypothetical protein
MKRLWTRSRDANTPELCPWDLRQDPANRIGNRATLGALGLLPWSAGIVAYEPRRTNALDGQRLRI